MKNKVIEKEKFFNKESYVLHTSIATCILFVLFSGVLFGQTTSKPSTNWLTFNGGFDAIRFSALTQITPKNVESIVM